VPRETFKHYLAACPLVGLAPQRNLWYYAMRAEVCSKNQVIDPGQIFSPKLENHVAMTGIKVSGSVDVPPPSGSTDASLRVLAEKHAKTFYEKLQQGVRGEFRSLEPVILPVFARTPDDFGRLVELMAGLNILKDVDLPT
jgi:hypothetical protein